MEITNSVAASHYQRARQATGPSADGADAAARLGGMAQDFAQTLKAAETTAQDALLGKVDTHALVEALAQTQLAVETAVTVRDKVVEAYQEILRMPV